MKLLDRARAFLSRFARKPGWPDPPKNEDHATYRDQYEKLLPVLRGLPRGDTFEERKTYLYLAELLIGLHNYGDDPIMPPGVRRIIERVQAEELPPVLIARTDGGHRPQGLMGALPALGGLQMLAWGAGAVILIIGIWQVDAARLRHDRDKRCGRSELVAGAATTRRPCVELGDAQRSLEHDRAALAIATQQAAAADRNAAATTETLRRMERQRQLRADQQRRSAREVQSIIGGVGDPPELGLRDDGPAADEDNNSGDADPS